MVIIGSDHTGYDFKNILKKLLDKRNIKYLDISGENKDTKDDYPDIAKMICKEVLEKDENVGIAICGTGIGISIACNKIKGIRAALVTDEYTAKMSKEHNNANVICLGARTNVDKNLEEIIDVYFNAEYQGRTS